MSSIDTTNPTWDISHLRSGLVATGALGALGVPLALWLRGGHGAFWLLVGLVIVAGFFSVSALAIALAGKCFGDAATLPAAVGTYLLKIGILGGVMVTIRDLDWLDAPALATAVLAGTVTWTAVHCRRVWTAKIYYVDP